MQTGEAPSVNARTRFISGRVSCLLDEKFEENRNRARQANRKSCHDRRRHLRCSARSSCLHCLCQPHDNATSGASSLALRDSWKIHRFYSLVFRQVRQINRIKLPIGQRCYNETLGISKVLVAVNEECVCLSHDAVVYVPVPVESQLRQPLESRDVSAICKWKQNSLRSLLQGRLVEWLLTFFNCSFNIVCTHWPQTRLIFIITWLLNQDKYQSRWSCKNNNLMKMSITINLLLSLNFFNKGSLCLNQC